MDYMMAANDHANTVLDAMKPFNDDGISLTLSPILLHEKIRNAFIIGAGWNNDSINRIREIEKSIVKRMIKDLMSELNKSYTLN